MWYAYVSCVAIAVGIYWYLNRHKPLMHILSELRTTLDMQAVGVAGLLDDKLQGWRNRIDIPVSPGKVAVITGGARGIGREVVRKLLEAKMVVVMGLRNPKAMQSLKEEFDNTTDLHAFRLDLHSQESVREFAENVNSTFAEVHLLINNAGIMFGEHELTVDGVESQFAVNYLGHFYLTHLLLPALRRAGAGGEAARVVNVSSCGHFPAGMKFDDINMLEHYDTTYAYAQSKLAQVMSARYINKVMEDNCLPVRCYSVHPGVVNTDLFEGTNFRKYFSLLMKITFKTPAQGAIPILYACFSRDLDKRGGLYISNCREGYSNSISKNHHYQFRLHIVSCEMLGVKKEEFGMPEEPRAKTII